MSASERCFSAILSIGLIIGGIGCLAGATIILYTCAQALTIPIIVCSAILVLAGLIALFAGILECAIHPWSSKAHFIFINPNALDPIQQEVNRLTHIVTETINRTEGMIGELETQNIRKVMWDTQQALHHIQSNLNHIQQKLGQDVR